MIKRKKYMRKTKLQLFQELAKAYARVERIKREIVFAVSDKPHLQSNLTSHQMCHLNCALRE